MEIEWMIFCYFLMYLIPNISITVCNVGYYKNGGTCTMCPGNTIKPIVGDTISCTATCDGTSQVPNSAHTDCGE